MTETIFKILDKILDAAKGPVWIASGIVLFLFAYHLHAFHLHHFLSFRTLYLALLFLAYIFLGIFLFYSFKKNKSR